MATALVVENDRGDDIRRLGSWLTEAGLELATVRPHAGEPLPPLDPYAALVVLGGGQRAYPGPAAAPGDTAGPPRPDRPRGAWFGQLEQLLRTAVRHRVPTLGICLGAQLLATAHGGTVAPAAAGPQLGPRLVGRRDAADQDPLFRWVPLAPDVIQWHYDEITELPFGAVLLAAATHYPHQAFRLGDRAWGLQFHIECDPAMVAGWAGAPHSAAALAERGRRPEDLVAAAEAVMIDLEEVWQPFAARFAALALGTLEGPAAPRRLPLVGM